jgi:flagellar motor switch protein FliM
MSETTQLQLLDFKHPRKPKKTKWRALARWHQSMCVLTTELWGALLTHETVVTAAKIEPFQCRSAFQQLPDDGFGVHFAVGASRFPSLFVFSRRQLHGLLADILNLEQTGWPEPRKFTRGEQSMLDLMFQRIADAISEAIPGPEATSCAFLGTFDKPERTRLFSQVDEVFVCELQIKSRFGTEPAYWLLPKTETEQLIGAELHEDEAEERGIHPGLASLAQRIQVDVVVELGHCDIAMSQVAQLAVGDVLVLDQPIHRPLTAYVSGERKWLGQPLRIGTRQGFEIGEMLAD